MSRRADQSQLLVSAVGRLVLVDCGVDFAPQSVLDAERMLPDLGLLAAYEDRSEAVLITRVRLGGFRTV